MMSVYNNEEHMNAPNKTLRFCRIERAVLKMARFVLEWKADMFSFGQTGITGPIPAIDSQSAGINIRNIINIKINIKMKQKFSLILALLSVCTCIQSFAQAESGRLSGIIIDSSGEEPLPCATVFIEELGKSEVADKNGEFSVSDIPFGTYTLTVKYVGYHAQTKRVTVDKTTAAKIIFQLESETSSLEEVMVVGKSEARKIREQAMPISVISMNQIQGTVNNVQDVLARTAGITVRTMGGVGSASRISVRGLEGKRIGLFIDGYPMNDNSDFIDLNDIPVEMINRIEIYKGVVPAKFGGSAVGGAVNIVIKEYPPKYLDVNYSYGSFNTHKTSVVSKMNIAPKGIEFGLGGIYNYADNNYKMESPFQEGLTITRDHDKFEKAVAGGSFKARKWWFDKVEFEPVFIYTYKDIQGIESNIQYAHSHSMAFVFANKIEKENFLLEGMDLDWQLAYVYTSYNFADTASYRTHWDGTHYPAVSRFGGEIGKWASLLTNDKHQLSHKLNLSYLVNNNHSVNLNSLLIYAHASPHDAVKDKVIGYRTEFPSNMLSWVVGLNYDYRSSDDKFLNSVNIKYYYYSMKTQMASILTNTAEAINTCKNDFGISNALRYRITPKLMAKASLGYDVRLPSEEELLGDGYVIAPAGNLTPERNTSVNVGMLFDLTGKSPSNLQMEINGFYMHLQDMIRFTGGFLQSQYQNFGEMRTLGVEAEVKADITRWLYGYANTTYQDLRDIRKYEQNTTVANPTKGSRMPNIPYLMANAGLEFHKENLFGGRGMNTRIFTDASFVEEYLYDFEQSQFQQHRIPRTFSCSMGFEQSFGNGRYFIMGKVSNLTDARMISEFNRPLPGRSFTVRLRYVFK